MARLNAEESAAHLGIAMSTFNSYRYSKYAPGAQLPTFPPGKDGTWLPSELDRWDKSRPGPGPAKGAKRGLYPCEHCGAMVPRRNVTPPTKKHPEGERLCKPCFVAGDPIHGEGG